MLDIVRDGQRELHALDAKLRIDGVVASGEGEEDENDVEANPLSFKNDDIAKLHAYRDALPYVRSARVLYPGNEVREFPALDADARDIDGVGAIPLVPGKAARELVRVIARILGKEPPQLPPRLMTHRAPTKKRHARKTTFSSAMRDVSPLVTQLGGAA